MPYSFQPFINILKARRKVNKLSQRDLATKLGWPQSHLSKIESGSVNLKLTSFIELARTLELEMVLVPRQDVAFVKGFILSKESQRHGSDSKPAYSLDDENENE